MKRLIRRMVVSTAIPPFDAVYQGIYIVIVRLAALILRRYRGVLSVYLTRGCAKNEITPGISDIDFIVVTADEAASRSVRVAVQALNRATAELVEYYPNMVAARELFKHRWLTAPAWQYRIHEGRHSWKLLFGEDILRSLPLLTEAQLKSACYLELCRWWMVFAQMLSDWSHQRDVVLSNATCYKTVGELNRVRHAMRTGACDRSRTQAIEDCDFPLAKRLRKSLAGRFLKHDAELVDDTLGYLVSFFCTLWEEFRSSPFLQVHPDVAQELDRNSSEIQPDKAVARHVETMRQTLEQGWGPSSSGVHLLRSVFWDLDEYLLIIDSDADALPTAEQLSDFVRQHRRHWRGQIPRISLFMRIGQVGFPLFPSIPRDLHRGLLTPATTPDVFLQLGEKPVFWTDFAAWYLCQWRTNEQWLEAPERKQKQMERIASEASAGRIVYPLAVAATNCKGKTITRGMCI